MQKHMLPKKIDKTGVQRELFFQSTVSHKLFMICESNIKLHNKMLQNKMQNRRAYYVRLSCQKRDTLNRKIDFLDFFQVHLVRNGNGDGELIIPGIHD